MPTEQINTLEKKFPEVTSKIINYVLKEKKWELFNLSPYDISTILSLDEEIIIDWMLYSVYVGLFDMKWNTLCPYCGSIEYQHESLNHLETDFFCIKCNININGELDDKVEVSFSPNKSLRDISFDAFENHESYSNYFFSNNTP